MNLKNLSSSIQFLLPSSNPTFRVSADLYKFVHTVCYCLDLHIESYEMYFAVSMLLFHLYILCILMLSIWNNFMIFNDRYCECFASGAYCEGCNCTNCFNNPENDVARREAIDATLERNPDAFRPKIGNSPHASRNNVCFQVQILFKYLSLSILNFKLLNWQCW